MFKSMILNWRAILLLSLWATTLLSGCSYSPPNELQRPVAGYGVVKDDDIAKITYDATDILVERSRQALGKESPILVATFVNVDKLDESSSFGRFMAEATADRMTQRGYYISEVKLRGTLALKKAVGQLMLSRDLERIRREHQAQAVVAGTYAVGREKVHVSLKLINVSTGQIVSALTYYLNLGPDTKALLGVI